MASVLIMKYYRACSVTCATLDDLFSRTSWAAFAHTRNTSGFLKLRGTERLCAGESFPARNIFHDQNRSRD
jgi:hypothetical protein